MKKSELPEWIKSLKEIAKKAEENKYPADEGGEEHHGKEDKVS